MGAKKKSYEQDMCNGPILGKILVFAIPLMISGILQLLFNAADIIVVGRFTGSQALAAVGSTSALINLIINLFIGVSVGANVVVARNYGAKDYDGIHGAVHTSVLTAIWGGIILIFVGILLARPMLEMMGTPEDVIDLSVLYMRIYFVGMPAFMMYNFGAAILRAIGDTKRPLYFLTLSGVVNVVLNLFFVIVFHMGVAGVALATIIAQIVSWLFGVFYINRHYDFIKIRPHKFYFQKELFFQAMRLGIPSGIQQALFSIGIMFMQSLVNSYGSSFMAGFNGANKIDTFAFLPVQSLSNALTTYTGQNIGAGNQHRVKEGLKASLIMSIGCCIVVGILLYPTSAFMMRMFSQNAEVIDAGVAYLHGVLPFYFLLAITFMYNSVLRGAGDMVIPMISSFVSLWLARLPAAYLIAHFFEKEDIYYSYAVGWALGVLISGIYYMTGKWKNKSIVERMKKQEA